MGLAVVLWVMIGAAPAQATTRFASPAGTGSTCSSAAPCSLQTAVSQSGSGDQVVMGPGTYSITTTLQVSGFALRGTGGQPRPVIDASQVAPGPGSKSVSLAGNSSIANVVIRNTQTQIGLYEDLAGPTRAVTVVGGSANECEIGPLTEAAPIDGLVCVTSTGTGALFGASATFGPTVVRDSVFASAPGLASVEVMPSGGGATFSLTNSILAATNGGQGAIQCDDQQTQIVLSHDFFDAYSCQVNQVTDDGTSSGALVSLANLATGDVHELSGSPTIDAGAHDSALDPTTDVYGDARVVGSAQDVGAAEFVLPPSASTAAVSGLTQRSAILNGTASTGGAPATAQFQWGASTAYGHTTPARVLAATLPGNSHLSSSLTGLSPDTTYHYRLVVTSSAGTRRGGDRSFTTPPEPPNTAITSADILPRKHRATFGFKGTGVVQGFQCALVRPHQSGPPSFASCSSPRSYASLARGAYRFLVRAFNAGGRDPTPASRSFTI